MKKNFNDLYGDFFSNDKKPTPKKPELTISQQPKEETTKPSQMPSSMKPLTNEQMQKMMDDLDHFTDEMNGLLSKNSQKISQGIKDLSKQNGLKEPLYQQPYEVEMDLNDTYEDLTSLVKKNVVGQTEAIEKMNIAFKRAFYQNSLQPVLNTILLCGPSGTGKTTILKQFANALYIRRLISSKDVIVIDMKEINDDNILIQDLYRAVQTPRSIIAFKNIDMASSVMLSTLKDFMVDGILPLKERYSLQNNRLVSSKNTLEKNQIDKIKANQNYFVLMSDLSLSKTRQKLGNQFLEFISDSIETIALDKKEILTLLKKDLAIYEENIKDHFHLDISFDREALNFLVDTYSKANGYHDVLRTLEDSYRALSDYLFNHPTFEKITLTCINHSLALNENVVFEKKKDINSEMDDIQKEMDEIIGLKEVKNYIYALKDMVAIKKRREQEGLKGAEISMHMIFTGNPGTGKTTMARLMARYLKALGVLKNGQLVEVTRADLVAQYVGQTAPKTKQVIESSLGGVLFIDEAYSLYRGKEDSFGLEAIDMIVKSMEDYKNEFIVVLAGYTKEMAVFLEANSGLKSRFPNMMEFPDYTAEELLLISKSQAKSKEYEIEAAAEQLLLDYFTKVQAKKDQRSGNGRLARNVIEDAILHQATRLMKEPDASLTLLTKEDFVLND